MRVSVKEQKPPGIHSLFYHNVSRTIYANGQFYFFLSYYQKGKNPPQQHQWIFALHFESHSSQLCEFYFSSQLSFCAQLPLLFPSLLSNAHHVKMYHRFAHLKNPSFVVICPSISSPISLVLLTLNLEQLIFYLSISTSLHIIHQFLLVLSEVFKIIIILNIYYI